MRCLLCGETIGAIRRLTDAEFCSKEHRRDWTEDRSNKLVFRLLEARQRLEAARDRQLAENRRPAFHSAEPPAAGFFVYTPAAATGAAKPLRLEPEFPLPAGSRMPATTFRLRSVRAVVGPVRDFPWPKNTRRLQSIGPAGLTGPNASAAA
jgi:hypothetical protein